MKKRRKRKILITVIALLVILRLFLPMIVKNYLNKVLAEIPEYTGAVEDVDISLWRGAYVIKGMHLSVVDAGSEIPFILLPKTDISVEWKSLLKGSIVSEIELYDPEIYYVLEDQEDVDGANQEDWTEALTDIVPLDINHLEIHNGLVGLVMVSTEPKIDLTLEQIELNADNLSNVVAEERTLPSSMSMSAKTFGDGHLNMSGGLNLLKEVPDMDITFQLEHSEVTALNDFTNHFGNVDFESGDFNVYGEMAIANSYLKGYVKPFIQDAKLIGSEDGFLETVWEGFIGFFKFILKNQKTDAVALRVQFEGDLDNVETPVWEAVKSIIRNAWVEAFKGKVDDSIEFQDAFQEAREED